MEACSGLLQIFRVLLKARDESLICLGRVGELTKSFSQVLIPPVMICDRLNLIVDRALKLSKLSLMFLGERRDLMLYPILVRKYRYSHGLHGVLDTRRNGFLDSGCHADELR